MDQRAKIMKTGSLVQKGWEPLVYDTFFL